MNFRTFEEIPMIKCPSCTKLNAQHRQNCIKCGQALHIQDSSGDDSSTSVGGIIADVGDVIVDVISTVGNTVADVAGAAVDVIGDIDIGD